MNRITIGAIIIALLAAVTIAACPPEENITVEGVFSSCEIDSAGWYRIVWPDTFSATIGIMQLRPASDTAWLYYFEINGIMAHWRFDEGYVAISGNTAALLRGKYRYRVLLW